MASSPTSTPLVGRDRELSAISAALEHAADGPAFVSFEGEPGIGKTRLLAEASAEADEAGWLVLDGRASEFERAEPFALFVDGLDDYLASLGPRASGRLEAHAVAELAGIFPAMQGSAGAPAPGPQEERYRAHAAVRSLLESLAVGHRLLLVLNNMH
jgi:predicted ATPase